MPVHTLEVFKWLRTDEASEVVRFFWWGGVDRTICHALASFEKFLHVGSCITDVNKGAGTPRAHVCYRGIPSRRFSVVPWVFAPSQVLKQCFFGGEKGSARLACLVRCRAAPEIPQLLVLWCFFFLSFWCCPELCPQLRHVDVVEHVFAVLLENQQDSAL